MNPLPPEFGKDRHRFSNEPTDGMTTIPQDRVEALKLSSIYQTGQSKEPMMPDAAIMKCPVDEKYTDLSHKNLSRSHPNNVNETDVGLMKPVWRFSWEHKIYVAVALVICIILILGGLILIYT